MPNARSVTVRLRADISNYERGMAAATVSTKAFERALRSADRSGLAGFQDSLRSSESSIDRLSGRLSLMARGMAALGPASIPMATAAVPAIAGLATQLGFAAAAAGTAVLAFNGVGDALGALNAYQLEPTAENLAKLEEEMRGLGPAAQEFVHFLDEITPQLQTLREAAQEGLLPGVQEGIDSLLDRLPDVRRIVSEIAEASGDLFAAAGAELASSQWDEFFAFVEAEARPALTTLGRTVGNLTKGIVELWMAMDPFSDDFTAGLLRASEAFESWAEGVDQTEGFQEFLEYVRATGPQVLETVGSLANMLLQVAEAAAPLGGPVLQTLEAVADTIALIADSDIGTPLFTAVAAMSALSLAAKGFKTVMGSSAIVGVANLTRDLRTMADVGVVAWGRSADEAMRYADATGRVQSKLKGASAAAKGFGLVAGAVAADFLADLGDTDYTLDQINRQLILMGQQGSAANVFTNLRLGLEDLSSTLHSAVYNDLDVLNRKLFGSSASFGVADEIKELDAALAALEPKQAAAAFDVILKEGRKAGLKVKQITELFPQYQAELRLSAKEARAAANASKSQARGVDEVKRALESHTTALVENLTAMRERRSLTLMSENAEIAYQAAIDDARRSLEENGRTLDITTDKGRANKTAILRMAEAWNNQTDAAKSTRGAHKAAIDTFVRVAGQLFKNEKAARRYARELFEIPPNQHTKVELDSAGARTSLREYRAMLGNIPRSITTQLTVDRVRGQAIPAFADGGMVSGDYRLAAGGLVASYEGVTGPVLAEGVTS